MEAVNHSTASSTPSLGSSVSASEAAKPVREQRAPERTTAERSAPSEGEREALDRNTVEQAANRVREQLQVQGDFDLKIEYERDVSQFIVQVIDPSTKELIKQIPPERLVELGQSLQEIRGLLFDEKS